MDYLFGMGDLFEMGDAEIGGLFEMGDSSKIDDRFQMNNSSEMYDWFETDD